MNYKLTDALLVLLLVSMPLFGLVQACGGGDPTSPDDRGGIGGGSGFDPNAPIAIYSVVGQTQGSTPFIATFDGSASYDPDGGPLEYHWRFSDGDEATDPIISHEFDYSGRHGALLTVTDLQEKQGQTICSIVYAWGLASSPWPKYARDQRNSATTDNIGPMMDLEHADTGGAFPKYWRSGNQSGRVSGISIGYDDRLFYAQGNWLRCCSTEGVPAWEFSTNGDITAWPAVLHDGSVVVGTNTGYLYRVSQNGQMIWYNNLAANMGLNVLGPAVNVGNDGTIYVTASIEWYNYQQNARLMAFGLDGVIKWYFDVPICHGENLTWEVTSVVPAILPDGNIVINGQPGYILTPGGDVVAILDHVLMDTHSYLGPPTINPDGQIAFTNWTVPVFNPDGTFVDNTLLNWYSGYRYAPVWSDDSVSSICVNEESNGSGIFQFWLNTGQGGLGFNSTNFQTKQGIFSPAGEADWLSQGMAQDGLGRLYVSCFGLHAMSPVSTHSLAPFAPQRYSMWSYNRPSGYMTAPVIGEDGWLYVGYGNDILAIGDNQ